MSNTLQIKRGANASLPTLAAGEFGFSTDTKQIYIGDGSNNHELATVTYVDNHVTSAVDPIIGAVPIETSGDLTVVSNESFGGSDELVVNGSDTLEVADTGRVILIG